MIAIAQPRKAASSSPRAPAKAAAGKLLATGRREAAKNAKRLAELRGRREAFFNRVIDFIPCPQFSKGDAERLATDLPADAAKDSPANGTSSTIIERMSGS